MAPCLVGETSLYTPEIPRPQTSPILHKVTQAHVGLQRKHRYPRATLLRSSSRQPGYVRAEKSERALSRGLKDHMSMSTDPALWF